MDNVFEADTVQGLRHQFHAAAVERGVNNLHVCVLGHGFGREHKGKLVFQIALIHFGAHDFDGGGGGAGNGGETYIGRVFNLGYFGHDILVHGGGDLAAVAPKHFVAVVLLGVVAGGDHNAGGGVLDADAVAQFRGGTQILEKIHLDAVVAKNLGRYLRKQTGVVAAVVADAHAGSTFHLFLDVVGEALGGHAHSVLVHAVGAHAHDAAEAAGAELQIPVKCVFQRYRIRFHQLFDFCFGLLIEIAGEPALCHFFVIFHIGCFSVILLST